MELFKSRTRVAYTNAVGDKVYPVVVDIKKGIKSTEDIQFVSSDVNTGILSVAFISGNENFNVSGADVVCSVMRPDASTLELPCEVVSENIVEVPLGINGTSQDGVYSFDFKVLKGGNKVVGTPIMNYSVSLSIGNDMVVEEDDRLPVLTMLMTQVTTLKNETTSVISTANTAIQNANKATDSTKLAISNAQSATQKAEDAITRVNNAIASGTQDLEVKDARDGEVSLKARLDRDIEKTNRELDKIKKLEESTVSTVTTESNFTTVEATNGGYFEDVKLEGKTLVNLWGNKSSDFRYSGQTSFNPSTQCIEYTSTTNRFSNCFTKNNTQYKPDTKYTIIVNVFENTFTSTTGILKVNSDPGGGSDLGVSRETINIQGGFVGVKVFTITTLSDLSNSNIAIRTYVDNVNLEVGAKLKFKMIILEGDHTQNPPGYFEGLKSVGDGADEIVVLSVKGDGNLVPTFDEFIVENNPNNSVVITDTKIEGIPSAGGFRVIKPIYFNKGSYTCSVDKYDGANARIRILNTDRSIKIANVINQSFTIDKSGLYIVSIENNGNTETSFSIEGLYIYKYGKQKPDLYSYQLDKKRLLYYNNETQAWEKPILREWDSIEKHADGKYYYHQRSGEVVLNGSENWGLNAGWSGEEMSTNSYYLTADGQKTAGLMVKSNGATNIISEVMPTVFINNTSFDSDCVSGENHTGAIYIRINKSKVSNGIKPYLQQNPMRVVYQLAEEKVYECTNIDLITYANETNYIVESGAIAPKSILKVHNNISNVVKILQEKVSLLENKFIEGLKQVLAGDMYSLAELLYPEDFEEVETENNIMLLPLE